VLLDELVSTAMPLTKQFSQLRANVDMCNFFHQCYYHRLLTSSTALRTAPLKAYVFHPSLSLSLSLYNDTTLHIHPLRECGAISRKLHTPPGLPPFFSLTE
jgi:hypothetical protein